MKVRACLENDPEATRHVWCARFSVLSASDSLKAGHQTGFPKHDLSSVPPRPCLLPGGAGAVKPHLGPPSSPTLSPTLSDPCNKVCRRIPALGKREGHALRLHLPQGEGRGEGEGANEVACEHRLPQSALDCRRTLRGRWLLTLLAAFALTASTHRLAAQSLQTLLTNGSVSNRFNIVLLSEGYTNADLGRFTTNAGDAVKVILACPPYLEYSNYFNAFAIPVASAQSRSDHPSSTFYRDTYFNSSFDLNDKAPSIPPNSIDSN
jgi:hypothetical protein